MDLIISPGGIIRAVYAEAIPLEALGPVQIRRASHVEPDGAGRWWADLGPAAGPVLGPFATRSEALRAELDWLGRHWPPGPR
ncbi:hypothetical protein EP7_003033 [Isosphaeraceae bacterium EP7]